MKPIPPVAQSFEGKLIVSCQAREQEAFHDPGSMARFAAAAVEGGAAGIRANGPADIRAIRQAVSVPVIGIQKVLHEDGRILITPSFDAARALVAAGAGMIALDCTERGTRTGALERLERIRRDLGVPVLADIATIREAIEAAAAGADFVLSTMRGYTAETERVKAFDPRFIADLCRNVEVPVIAEGRIHTPEQAAEALAAGAFAVVVGSAITRPQDITRRFALALSAHRKVSARASYIGIDLGGTNTKSGIVGPDGTLIGESSVPTPFTGGREVLLEHLARVGTSAIQAANSARIPIAGVGIATAGWVDPHTGRVVYATGNLPGWTGTAIAERLRSELGLPVAVENDANAVALAEKHFGLGKDLSNFVCITLGTGVGGGCYVGGQLNRGKNFFANAVGHLCLEAGGLPCTCGQKGCLEVYANAAALVRYAGATFSSAEEVIERAGEGDVTAREAVRIYARYLARGCALLVQLLDPEMIIFSGGLAQNNAPLLAKVEQELSGQVTVWRQRGLQLRISPLGYFNGVLGAAAAAIDLLPGE